MIDQDECWFPRINMLERLTYVVTKVQAPAAILTRVAADAKMLLDPGNEHHASQEVSDHLHGCSHDLCPFPYRIADRAAFATCFRRPEPSRNGAAGARGAGWNACLYRQSHNLRSFLSAPESHQLLLHDGSGVRRRDPQGERR